MRFQKEYHCKIGPLLLKLHSNNSVSKHIISDLDAVDEQAQEGVDIEVFIDGNEVHEHYKPDVFSAKGSMNFNENEFFVGYLDEIDYTVKNLFGSGKVDILIDHDKTNIKKKLKSLYKKRISIEKDVILSYSLLWYVAHLALLKKKSAFVHSGVFKSDKGATIITGTGGCGKTSTLFKILEDEQYSYLAEDFGIIDSEGYTYFNPKPVSVYASDVEFGQAILKNYFTKFSLKEKLLWFLKRKIARLNPMRKIPPIELMDQRIGQKTRIRNVLYFIRNSDDSLSIADVSPEDLAERVLDASARELKTLNELLLLMRSNAPKKYNIPSFEDVTDETRRLYIEIFNQTNRKIIYIPHRTSPEVLTRYLRDHGLI